MQSSGRDGMAAPSSSHARRVVTTLAIGALVVALGAIVVLTYHFLLLVFAGLLLAVLLRGAARPIHRHLRLPAKLAVALAVVLLLAIATAAALLVWPHVAAQVRQLIQELPAQLADLRELARESEVGRDLLRAIPALDEIVPEDGAAIVDRVTGVFSSTFGILTSVFVIIAVGLFLAFEPGVYVRGVLRLVPPDRRRRASEVLEELRVTLFHWLIARFVGMTVIGLFSWLGLSILGIPLALALGLLAALLTFIPNVGPVLSVIPPVLLALPQGLATAGLVLALYGVIQFLESYLITPMVERIAVSLPPAMIITAQIVLGFLGGILGLILATPLAAVVLVLVRRFYVEDTLHDDLELPPTI